MWSAGCGGRPACGRSPRSRTIRPKPPLSRSKSVARRTCSRRCSDCRFELILRVGLSRKSPSVRQAQGKLLAQKTREKWGNPACSIFDDVFTVAELVLSVVEECLCGESVSAAHPQQAVQFHAGCGGGVGVERVTGIDQSAEFSTAGGGGQSGQQQGGASGGGGAADFGQASAGQAAGQGVEGGDAAGNHFGRWTDIELRRWSYVRQAGVGRCARSGPGGLVAVDDPRPAQPRRDTSGTALASKTKGRPRAAEVETTAEDIRFLGRFQGTPGLVLRLGRGGVFAFYSPIKILLRRGGFVKPEAEKARS